MPRLRTHEPAKVLTAIELERQVSLLEAERIAGISAKTIERNYPNLIRRASPRRRTIRLRDVLAIGRRQD